MKIREMMFIAVISFLLIFTAGSSFASPPKAKIIKNERIEATIFAYYLPSPKQKKFVTGSYKGDIRMNGTGVTLTGKKVRKGFAAADFKLFPPGTKLFIPGHGEVVIEDVGGKIKGRRIDIFVGEGDQGLEKALNWGKQRAKVIVLAWGR